MSQENVDVVRQLFAACGDVERVVELVDEEAEIRTLAGMGVIYRGHDGIRQYFEDLRNMSRRVRAEPAEYLDCGDAVLVSGRLCIEGMWGESDLPAAWVFEVAGGRVTRCDAFTSRRDALDLVARRGGAEDCRKAG